MVQTLFIYENVCFHLSPLHIWVSPVQWEPLQCRDPSWPPAQVKVTRPGSRRVTEATASSLSTAASSHPASASTEYYRGHYPETRGHDTHWRSEDVHSPGRISSYPRHTRLALAQSLSIPCDSDNSTRPLCSESFCRRFKKMHNTRSRKEKTCRLSSIRSECPRGHHPRNPPSPNKRECPHSIVLKGYEYLFSNLISRSLYHLCTLGAPAPAWCIPVHTPPAQSRRSAHCSAPPPRHAPPRAPRKVLQNMKKD